MNANVVISPSNVKLGKKGGVLHVIDQLRNEGERVSIVNGMAIKVAIVLTGSKSSVFLWDKEEWGSLWRLGGYDLPSL